MTLIAVEASPTLRLVSKASEVDPGGTHELLRLALYETLCDQVDAARPFLERDLDEYITKRDDAMRRAQVRAFIDARLAGADVSEIAKNAPATDNDRKHGWFRDILGRFASHASSAGNRANTGSAMASVYLDSKDSDNLDDPFDKPRYSSLRATGAALTSMNDPNARAIGGAAQAVGNLGPEAERVLGQGLRRTAYRYRGTEKLPDRTLKSDIKNALKIIDPDPAVQAVVQRALNAQHDEEIRSRATAGKPFDRDRSDVRRAPNVNPSVQIATYWRDKRGISEDAREMNTAGDVAARYFLDKLPSEEQTRISIAAGAVPPSQGVIIDADGDVVSEAMGYNGDHYVPFDLKNLRSLHGGQYVRTRATGGPTTEDIYTGLLSGARQLQVVSQSGVFTLEFDPSVRGGRRYSDKARQMVSRYERLLDAVDQGEAANLYQHDLTPKEIRDIRQGAVGQFSDPRDEKKYVTRMINEKRRAKSFAMLTDEEIDERAREMLKDEQNPPRGRLQELRNEVKDKARQDSVKAFTLDGDGYDAALKALKQEFPYFIRDVRRERLPDFVDARGLQDKTKFSSAGDRGYVSPKTRTAGLARSVTEDVGGTQVQRGFYDAPARRGSRTARPPGEDVSGAPEAGAAASGGSTAAAAAVPAGGVLAHPGIKRLANQMAKNLTHGLPFMKIDQSEYLVPEKDADFRGMMPNDTIQGALDLADANKEDFASHLQTMGPVERQALKDALTNVDDLLEGTNIPQPVRDRVNESAEMLLSMIKLTTPFKQGNPLADLPEDGNPLHFDDIAKLGFDLEKFQRNQEHQISEGTLLGNYIEQFDSADPDESDSEVVIGSLMKQYDDAKDEDDKKNAAKKLIAAQKALSFIQARDLAEEYHKLAGSEPPVSPGKAPAPKGATVPYTKPYTQGFKKRVTWHPPGSPVATEFQKFLAQRP